MSLPSSPSRFSGSRSITPSQVKTVDVGSPLAVYDTNSVRDRVRQWQAQGGGVVAAVDVGGEENAKTHKSPVKSTTSREDRTLRTPSKSDKGRRGQNTRSRTGRRSVDTDDSKRVRTRSGSAPAKRIVSDGHWKNGRTPLKSATSSRATKTDISGCTQPDDSIRIRSVLENSGKGRQRAGRTTKRASIGGDDGIRVYVTPPGSHGKVKESRPQQSESSGSEKQVDHGLEATDTCSGNSFTKQKRPVPEQSLPESTPPTKSDSERRKSGAQKIRDGNDSPCSARGALSLGQGSTKSQKGNLLSQVFGFAKHAPEPIPTPRVPSIEAWLNETPDPFIEPDKPPFEPIAPLKPSVAKRRSIPKQDVVEEVEDPNRIWDALDTKEGTRRAFSGSRREKRIPSSAIYEDNPFPPDFDSDTGLSGSGVGSASASKFVDLVHGQQETLPSVVARRSGKKRLSSGMRDRGKSMPSRESGPEDAAVSGLSLNLTTSSVEGPGVSTASKSPGSGIKRPFPSTGRHRLSTIASVETFSTKNTTAVPSISEMSGSTIHPILDEENEAADEARDLFDPNSLKRSHSRFAKHSDLMSILSLPDPSSGSIKSARSIRTNRSRLATATVGDLMQELAMDESKYTRELRTLVDGVIPVLLTCVLSKSDSAVAAGLFRPSAPDHEDPNFTKPIVDMGIALVRMNSLHKHIPKDDPITLLTWAHGAQRVYSEYLKAWRMGFQDVVVNLAPFTENNATAASSSTTQALDEGLPRNDNGDVINGDGERVDVAFLLKRPLIRLKYLQKTLKGINIIKPSAEAASLAAKYQDLVEVARRRSNEERARLEDEAASNIDPSRARDPRNLAPTAGVVIDRTRRVRARDNFDLALQHSSGQCVDCRAELILRDEAPEFGNGGDLLICEVDARGKWLLFPPVQSNQLSARNGDIKGEIVVMVRGISGDGSDWQELLSLRSEDEQAGFEWVHMLGLTPVPPRVKRSQSFLNKRQRHRSAAPKSLEAPSTPVTPGKSRTPSPREIEVPIGEQANHASQSWVDSITEGLTPKDQTLPSREVPSSQAQLHDLPSSIPSKSSNYVDQVSELHSLPSQKQSHKPNLAEITRTPRSFKEALGLSGTSTTVGLKRARANRRSRYGEGSPSSSRSREGAHQEDGSEVKITDATKRNRPSASSAGNPSQLRSLSPEPSGQHVTQGLDHGADQQKNDARPPNDRARCSVPSMELPYIPKARQNSPPTTPTFELEQEPAWPSPVDTQQGTSSTLTKRRPVPIKAEAQPETSPPAPPTHRSSSPVQLSGIRTPNLTKAQIRPRRSSSPLKHQYEPSTASESSSESDTSTVEHRGATSVSDSSEDEELEERDAPTPLLPLVALKRPSTMKTPARTLPLSAPDGSIKPSESASQAPYKAVPPQPTKASKTIASIFSWLDTGSWQSLHPDECSIVITPGLIEAYQMSAAHSKDVPLSSSIPVTDADAFSELTSNMTVPDDEGQCERPLIALELTPLVPLRRGTALDISIRSPPTPNSQITSGNNIMFRSRNPEECEALYALINHSRINNPTFIALQNARASGNSFGPDRRTSTSAGNSRSSWFGGWGRSSSYRASSAPTPSIAPSESSIGSVSSVFSALRQFGKGSPMFNISRSTITSREGSRANSIYTSSDHSGGSGTSSPNPLGLASERKDSPIGLSDAKIRLYQREAGSNWRDMGSARLTIMRPENSSAGQDERPGSRQHQGMDVKRIRVNGKTKGEVLLDVQLGETCFERIGRTGIAVKVWEDVVGPNGEVGVVGAVGGVGGGKVRLYMIQVCCPCCGKGLSLAY
jgi:hypothetical protein